MPRTGIPSALAAQTLWAQQSAAQPQSRLFLAMDAMILTTARLPSLTLNLPHRLVSLGWTWLPSPGQRERALADLQHSDISALLWPCWWYCWS